MRVFADTSALYAVLVRSDEDHARVAEAFPELLQPDVQLVTSSYVRQELVILLQARVGIPSIVAFQHQIEPWLQMIWIDEVVHARAMSALIASGSRRVSLTDRTSFEVMRSLGIRKAFALDAHFSAEGFDLVP